MEAELSRESKPSYVKRTWRQKRWCESSVPITLRPIRLLQLIFDIMLVSVTISFMTRPKSPMSTAASIILTILFASFAIVMSIDAVGQIGGCLTPDLPMFLVDILGLILFTSAAQAVYLLGYQGKNDGFILVLIALCLFAALLFLLDAMIMILYWRYTYTTKPQCLPCHPSKSFTILYQKPAHEKASKILEPITRDISTSFSEAEMQSFHSGSLELYRSNNRVGVGPRRQYVDRATSPDSNASFKLVETQTKKIEPPEQTDNEISAIAMVEEKDAQTFSPCPVCSAALDYSPQGICPTFLNLVQAFGMFSCPGNLRVEPEAPFSVDRGTLPESNSSSTATGSTVMIAKKPPRVYETRACPTHGAGLKAQKAGLPSPVKMITLSHCIKKHKRTQTRSIEPILITDSSQNTETVTAEETTNIESSPLGESSLIENQSSEKADIPAGHSSDNLVKTEGMKEENFSGFEDSFSGRESSEEAKVMTLENRVNKNMEDSTTGMKSDSVSIEESSFKVLSSLEIRENDRHLDSEENTSEKNIARQENDEIGSTPSGTESSPIEEASSGKFQASSREDNLLVEIEESFPTVGGSFTVLQSSDKLTREMSVINTFENTEEATTESGKSSLSNKEYSFSEVRSSVEKKKATGQEKIASQRNIFQKNNKVESITSTQTSLPSRVSSYSAWVTSTQESTIHPTEISRHSSKSRKSASPVVPCKCTQNYYKDVFGRYICTLCAHKYLMKIPQRNTVKPAGNIRCCSCSQSISHQVLNAGHSKCKCRYDMYASGSKK